MKIDYHKSELLVISGHSKEKQSIAKQQNEGGRGAEVMSHVLRSTLRDRESKQYRIIVW